VTLSRELLEQWMHEALQEACRADAAGEVPVGAIVVGADGAVVARGWNRPIGACDPTAHAEMVALREAARALGNYRLAGCTLVVTVEPCLMCVGALVHARVARLVYGAREPKAGAVLSAMCALEHPRLNHRFPVIGGVLEAECRAVVQGFFERRRAAAGESRAGAASRGPDEE